MENGQQPNEPGWVFKPGDKPTESGELPAVKPAETQKEEPVTNAEPVAYTEPPASNAAISDEEVTWTASEYVANPKNSGWFMLLGLASVVLAVVVYFVTSGDIVSTVVTLTLGIMVGIFAARQPRTLQYRIDSRGLSIGQKFYPYEGFKSFSIANEHALNYIALLPLKRFMPPLTVHYDQADEDRIINTLADYLPFEDHKPDVVDNIARRIRF